MKKILLLIFLLNLCGNINSQQIEESKTYTITPKFSLDLTDVQYKQLERFFKHQQRSKDWARYNFYEENNQSLKKAPEVVFMGNSITQGLADKNKEYFLERNWLGRGIGGQTSYQMLARFQSDVVNLKPKVVVIMAGTNDIANNDGIITYQHILENIKTMCDVARYNNITPVLCSVLPVYQYGWHKELGIVADKIKQMNTLIKKFAETNNLVYVDYYSLMVDEKGAMKKHLAKDGVHPNPEGQKIMLSYIEPILNKMK